MQRKILQKSAQSGGKTAKKLSGTATQAAKMCIRDRAVPGQPIRYVFSQLKNSSNVALDSFYWRDQLPAQVTLSKIVTLSLIHI